MSLWSILHLTLNSDLKVNTICTYLDWKMYIYIFFKIWLYDCFATDRWCIAKNSGHFIFEVIFFTFIICVMVDKGLYRREKTEVDRYWLLPFYSSTWRFANGEHSYPNWNSKSIIYPLCSCACNLLKFSIDFSTPANFMFFTC